MAYNVPDETGYTYKPRSAQAQVAGYAEEDALKREDDARAAAAGVTSADKIDYAAALRNYESRPDAELFANRRAREYAVDFADQDFARVTIDLAGPVQSSTIGTTSVVDGAGYYFDDNSTEPFQPVLSNGDNNSGSGIPAPDRAAAGDPDADGVANATDTNDDNDAFLDTQDSADFNPNVGQSTVPDAPTGVTAAVASATSATVTWTAPNDGGEPITGYTVTASTGQTVTVAGGATTATVTGLATGVAVTFTVVATNGLGNSAPSAASNSVTPA